MIARVFSWVAIHDLRGVLWEYFQRLWPSYLLTLIVEDITDLLEVIKAIARALFPDQKSRALATPEHASFWQRHCAAEGST